MLICLGDSHSSVFSLEERIISQWPKKDFKIFSRFKPIRIGPATAYNLESKVTLLNQVLNRTFYFKSTYVLFCFGEVDIRAHLIKQAELQNKQIDIIIKDCVDRYINAIKKVNPIRKINKAVFAPILVICSHMLNLCERCCLNVHRPSRQEHIFDVEHDIEFFRNHFQHYVHI